VKNYSTGGAKAIVVYDASNFLSLVYKQNNNNRLYYHIVKL